MSTSFPSPTMSSLTSHGGSRATHTVITHQVAIPMGAAVGVRGLNHTMFRWAHRPLFRDGGLVVQDMFQVEADK